MIKMSRLRLKSHGKSNSNGRITFHNAETSRFPDASRLLGAKLLAHESHQCNTFRNFQRRRYASSLKVWVIPRRGGRLSTKDKTITSKRHVITNLTCAVITNIKKRKPCQATIGCVTTYINKKLMTINKKLMTIKKMRK